MARALLLGTVLLASTLTGCIGDGEEDTTPLTPAFVPSPDGALLEAPDAVDDARYRSDAYAMNVAYGACRAASPVRPACWQATRTGADALPDVGTSAPPSAEITAVRLREGPDVLRVELELAGLDEDLDGLLEDLTILQYAVCWSEDGWDPAGECVALQFSRGEGGPVVSWIAYDEYSPKCNWWWWCSREVPVEAQYGEPGAIVWSVPREIMPNATKGQTLDSVEAMIFGIESEPDRVSYGFDDPASPVGRVSGSLAWSNSVPFDALEAPDFTFELDPAPVLDASWRAYPFDAVPAETGERTDLKVLAVDLVETPTHLTISTQVARVDEVPDDVGLYAALGAPSARVYEFYIEAADGSIVTWTGVPTDATFEQYRSFPVRFEIEPGSPGRIDLTVLRADLELFAAGERTNLLFVSMGSPEASGPSWEDGARAGPVYLGKGSTVPGSWSGVGPPYEFVHDTEPLTGAGS